ncbi:MAG: RES family NAD+ phosphorylase [Holophagales bacterium]|nr:RES family NAD+ phosphorylase [Holophagales bacterium]MYG30225.1 RES family NAD+ phosphorylase [Holophagales bacterium]MYI81033.1 RES family NAD+ phosphorylase [Holophagales bacterium]
MKVWRLARTRWAPDVDTILNGEGALRRGGRWSPAGMRAVYCSETSSLAVLEILVGLPFGVDHPAYRIVDLTLPDDSIVHLDVESAAPGSQSLGASALNRHLAIAVPSVVNPLEKNVVINPLHPRFDHVKPGLLRSFRVDPRLG